MRTTKEILNEIRIQIALGTLGVILLGEYVGAVRDENKGRTVFPLWLMDHLMNNKIIKTIHYPNLHLTMDYEVEFDPDVYSMESYTPRNFGCDE